MACIPWGKYPDPVDFCGHLFASQEQHSECRKEEKTANLFIP